MQPPFRPSVAIGVRACEHTQRGRCQLQPRSPGGLGTKGRAAWHVPRGSPSSGRCAAFEITRLTGSRCRRAHISVRRFTGGTVFDPTRYAFCMPFGLRHAHDARPCLSPIGTVVRPRSRPWEVLGWGACCGEFVPRASPLLRWASAVCEVRFPKSPSIGLDDSILVLLHFRHKSGSPRCCRTHCNHPARHAGLTWFDVNATSVDKMTSGGRVHYQHPVPVTTELFCSRAHHRP